MSPELPRRLLQVDESLSTDVEILWVLIGAYLVFFMQVRLSLFISLPSMSPTVRFCNAGSWHSQEQEHKQHPVEESRRRLRRCFDMVEHRLPHSLRKNTSRTSSNLRRESFLLDRYRHFRESNFLFPLVIPMGFRSYCGHHCLRSCR